MGLIAAALAAAAAWSLCGLPLPGEASHARINPTRLLVSISAAAMTGAITVVVATPAVAVVAAAAAAGVPGALDSAARHRAARKRADAWPDLLAGMRGRLAAGDDVPDALIASAEGPLIEIRAAVTQGRVAGVGLAESLERIRTDWADPTADRVLVTLAAAARTGGSRVSELISALGVSVADELRLRRAHDAETTQQRLTATVALIAPWALLAFSIATNPQAASAFEGGAGAAVIWAGGAATGLGYVLARRTVALSAAPRVFA